MINQKRKSQILTLFLPIILLIIVVILLIYQYKKDIKVTKSALKLNTYIKVTLYGTNDGSLIDGAFDVCDQYESLLSKTIQTSDVTKFNTRTSDSVSLNKDTIELIQYGLSYSKLSNGAFDIAVGQLTNLWDFTADNPIVPNDSDIQSALSHVGYQTLHIDGTKLSSTDKDVMLDLGGIAKGYIADKMKDYLVKHGVKSATINLGGNVLCIGKKPDGSPFKIGIQKPFSDQGEILLAIENNDGSIVTSGTYERYFTKDNRIYHHILDPSTGYPYDNGLVSVTILSKASVDGDGLSTSCFALGLDDGLKLINSLDDVYAIFVTNDNKIHYSDGLKEAYHIENPNS